MKWTLILVPALALAVPARADVVYLTNGRSVEGKVTEAAGRVTVAMTQGSVSFPRDQVKRIEKSESVVEVFERKRAALADGDAAARAALGTWARGEGMEAKAKELFREAMAIDPDQAKARQGLGFVLFNGKWMTPDEKMRAMGMVQFEGQWVTPEAVADIKRQRAETRAAEEQRRKAEADVALKSMEIEKLRAECARVEAERRLLEAERAKVEAERARLESLIRSYPVFRCAMGHTWYHPDCPACRRVPIVIISSGADSRDKDKDKDRTKDQKGATDPADQKDQKGVKPILLPDAPEDAGAGK
jgi:hypothetical protein